MIGDSSRCQTCRFFKALLETNPKESNTPQIILMVDCSKRGIVKALSSRPSSNKCTSYEDTKSTYVLDMENPMNEWTWEKKE